MPDKNLPADNDDLGRLIYGEPVHITPAVTYTLLGCVFLTFGILCCFLENAKAKGSQNVMLVLGGVAAIVGGLCLTSGLVRLIPNLGASWQLHEHGIKLTKGGNIRVLRYEDIDELTMK